MMEDIHRPLAVYRYRMTVADALAYERLPGEWTGWQKAAMLLPVMAIGALAGFLEDELGVWWWAAVAGLLLIWAAIGLAVHNCRIHRRARRRAAREGEVEVEEWGGHLAIRSAAGEVYVADETIGKVLVGDGHVFVLYGGGPLIVPLRAFQERALMQAFGAALDRRSEAAAP